MGRVRSQSSPFRRATIASSAKRGLISLATWRGVDPEGTLLTLPSGRVTWRLFIGNLRLTKRAFARHLGDENGRRATADQAAVLDDDGALCESACGSVQDAHDAVYLHV